jgi:hypothetical protein
MTCSWRTIGPGEELAVDGMRFTARVFIDFMRRVIPDPKGRKIILIVDGHPTQPSETRATAYPKLSGAVRRWRRIVEASSSRSSAQIAGHCRRGNLRHDPVEGARGC